MLALKDIDKHCDYYVGQWDYGNPHTGLGCYCDKSTSEQAIKMIVKSGIDTTKVYGGLANYGGGFTLSNKIVKTIFVLFLILLLKKEL